MTKPQILFIIPCIDSQYNFIPCIKNYIRDLYKQHDHNIAIIAYKDYQIESYETARLRFKEDMSLEDLEEFFLKLTYSASNKISEGKGCLEIALYEALQFNWDMHEDVEKELIFFSQKDPNTPNAPLNDRQICAKTCIDLLQEKDIHVIGCSILEHNANIFSCFYENHKLTHREIYDVHNENLTLYPENNYKDKEWFLTGYSTENISKFQTLHLKKDVNIQSFLDAMQFQCKRRIYIEQKNLKKFKKDRTYIGKKENVFSYVFSIEQYKEGNYDKIYETNQKNTTLKHDSEVLYIPLFS